MNFQTKGGALRVSKSKLKDGDTSLTISLVRNMRINGNPSHRCLAKIMTVRQSELSARAVELYRILDKQVAKLTAEGVLWRNDASFIEQQISKVVARPIPAPTPKSDHELLRNLIKEVAAKAEKRLNAQGV